jgi:hypothetical protein
MEFLDGLIWPLDSALRQSCVMQGAAIAMTADWSLPWATGALVGDPAQALKTIEQNFAVHLIATPRSAFRTCFADESLVCVVERNRSDQFDFLPVLEPESESNSKPARIIGLIELVPFLDGTVSANESVRSHMQLLSEENLIGANASILSFVRDADRHRCRLVISDCDISGLVSLSDLQRLPVRAALFTMVTHLEILMSHLIRLGYPDSSEWLKQLSLDRQKGIRDEIDASRRDNSFIDDLLFTQFADKVMIIKKSALISSNKTQFKKDLGRVRNLRDDLAHANDYAASRDAARSVSETVRVMDKWIEEFARRLSSSRNDYTTPSR